MAIKKLQNNYTTPEQSKMLLALGVPADSADCYHNQIAEKPYLLTMPYSYSNWSDKRNPPLPCWSVGRLFEIIGICAGMEYIDFEFIAWTQGEWSEKLISIIKDLVKYDKIDFSKLEE
jgi:hypothetical protein